AISEEGPFEKITERRIEGAGTSASAVDYEYVDEKIEEGMTYFYKIESMDYDGTKYMKDIVVRVQELRVPKKFALSQNFPNPFNPETSIRYTLPYATAVRLVIYNSSGQLVRTLVDGAQSMGVHSVSWNGETDSGVRAASGIYFYKLQAGSFDQIRRMVFLR
ncbi:MAG: T9SS type A sorting domain-containing protein, partial [Candidatus Latescibacteria bacterium]|nr:T9SS type A sorting domain-containing protein [Candidatus Latescibacterota bacterium]